MEARCEICGCPTEEEFLSDYSLSGEQFKICSYCKKRLEAIADNPKENYEQALNIFKLDNPHRSPTAQAALVKFFGSLGVSEKSESVSPKKPVETVRDAEIKRLEEKIDRLEKKVEKYRRKYIISKVIEIAVPVLLILIVFIIMIASGALDNLVNYYNTIIDYANM